MIKVTDELWIDENELEITASRASGPGGQHVNKTSSKVTVSYSISGSKTLTDELKTRLLGRLGGRVDGSGKVAVSCQEYRSQLRNRDTAIERLVNILAAAMAQPKRRKKTRVPYGAKQARLDSKRRQSEKKQQRKGEF